MMVADCETIPQKMLLEKAAFEMAIWVHAVLCNFLPIARLVNAAVCVDCF